MPNATLVVAPVKVIQLRANMDGSATAIREDGSTVILTPEDLKVGKLLGFDGPRFEEWVAHIHADKNGTLAEAVRVATARAELKLQNTR